jgi:hypothetical protein
VLSTTVPHHTVKEHIPRRSERFTAVQNLVSSEAIVMEGELMNEEALSTVRDCQAKVDPIKTSDRSRSEATVRFSPDKYPLCFHKTYMSVADSSFSADAPYPFSDETSSSDDLSSFSDARSVKISSSSSAVNLDICAKVAFSILLTLNIHFNDSLLLLLLLLLRRTFPLAFRKRIPVVAQKRRAIGALVELETHPAVTDREDTLPSRFESRLTRSSLFLSFTDFQI